MREDGIKDIYKTINSLFYLVYLTENLNGSKRTGWLILIYKGNFT